MIKPEDDFRNTSNFQLASELSTVLRTVPRNVAAWATPGMWVICRQMGVTGLGPRVLKYLYNISSAHVFCCEACIMYECVESLSHVRLPMTPCTAAHQVSLSMGFSRQEYWGGLPFPSLCIMYAAAAAAKSLQSCPTLCDPIDSSPSGFPVPGILQARTLQWVAISFSNA